MREKLFTVIVRCSLCQKYGEGGAGGVPDHPITACDEKNLLAEPGDPYQRGSGPYSQDICVHELAHTIMNVGLSQADRDRIYQRYPAAKQEGRWGAGDYAMTNEMKPRHEFLDTGVQYPL